MHGYKRVRCNDFAFLWHHITEEHSVDSHCCENLKFHNYIMHYFFTKGKKPIINQGTNGFYRFLDIQCKNAQNFGTLGEFKVAPMQTMKPSTAVEVNFTFMVL